METGSEKGALLGLYVEISGETEIGFCGTCNNIYYICIYTHIDTNMHMYMRPHTPVSCSYSRLRTCFDLPLSLSRSVTRIHVMKTYVYIYIYMYILYIRIHIYIYTHPQLFLHLCFVSCCRISAGVGA